MERYWNPVETAPIHEMKALQSLRLSQTVRHVYEHVPFYRKKFDEMGLKPENIQSIDDISKLPFTYKQDLRDNYPYGLFAVPVEDLVRIHASSGTTGKQTVVGYTQNDIKIWGNCCGRLLAETPEILFMFLMGMVFLREDLVCMPEQKKFMQRLSRFLPVTPNVRFRFLKILALLFSAVRLLMHCS